MITHDGVFTVESEAGWDGAITVFCDDPPAAGRALTRASPRLQRVLWTGREVSEQDWAGAMEAAEREGASELLDFCEYVSDPDVHEEGASIYMDTNSELSQAAATTFFTILSEELRTEGVEDANIGVDER
jgi:hypothetical protein